MKKIFTITALLLFVFTSYSQKKGKGINNGYGNIGLVITNTFDGGIGANFASGIVIKKVASVGLGFDVIKMNNYDRRWYTSMYLDLRGYLYKGIYITGQGGYSFFDSPSQYAMVKTTTKAGIYYAGGIGYFLPKTKVSPFVCLKATNYTLTRKVTTQVRVSPTRYEPVTVTSNLDEIAGTITIGVKF